MKDLTTGHEGKLILNFATPMLLGNIFQQLYNVVDSIIVGNFIGKEALAAVGASFPVIFTLISFIIGIASGGTIIIAQYFGAKDYEKVKKTIGTMYIFIFFASIILTIIGITLSDFIFHLIQLPEEVIPQAKIYLNTFLLGLVIFFGFNVTSAILRGLGDSKTPLYFLIIASLFNVILDLLFVVVFNWGVRGVALATVISHGGAFVTAILYLNKTHKIININLSSLRFDRSIFYQSIRIGVPTGLQHTFVSLGTMALFRIVNGFGTNVIAAYSVAGRIENLVILPAMNFGQALSTFVGQNIGAKKIERVRSGLLATFLMSSVVSVVISLILILFRSDLVGLFTKDTHVVSFGAQYLLIVAPFYIIFSSMFCLNGVMRGAGDTIIPMFITLFSLWIIRIPFAWMLSQKMGETGIWWAVPLSWFTGLVFAFIYYMSGRWKLKSVVK
ncbi:MAG: MATE family efflux transporter [Bacteroidales bacterium]|nr:MATE family efflux transporter [Bacteroidales bacterium]